MLTAKYDSLVTGDAPAKQDGDLLYGYTIREHYCHERSSGAGYTPSYSRAISMLIADVPCCATKLEWKGDSLYAYWDDKHGRTYSVFTLSTIANR